MPSASRSQSEQDATPWLAKLRLALYSLAGSQRAQAFDQGFGMHRLPDTEIALKLNVCVGGRERLGPCGGVDDSAVDHLDDASATSQVVSKGSGRGRCVAS